MVYQILPLFLPVVVVASNDGWPRPFLSVHPDRVQQINELQATKGMLWEAAPQPRFASEPPGASEALCGTFVIHIHSLEVTELPSDVGEQDVIPDAFDSAEEWPHCAEIIGDIRDQSMCGCCWAFAGAEAASDRMCIATNGSVMLPLSAQDVCFNGGGNISDGCNGGYISSPWAYMRQGGQWGRGAVSGGQYNGTGPFGGGFCSDFTLPHCHHHGPQGSDPYPDEGTAGCPLQSSPPGPTECDADAVPPHDNFEADKYSFDGEVVNVSGERDIQRAVMAGGPMSVAFTVYSDFENYQSGVYQHVNGESVGSHAVKLVGWGVDNGVKYWKLANSWNKYWGEQGYFRMLRGVNECGIEDQAIASSPDAKWSRAGTSFFV